MDFSSESFDNRRFLFQNIARVLPNNPWVIKATEKMKTYSKDEYAIMLQEAYDFQNEFDKAVDLGISAKTAEGKRLFILFVKHINWFFEIDEYAYNELLELCSPSTSQFLIVNKAYSDLLFDILTEYKQELGI